MNAVKSKSNGLHPSKPVCEEDKTHRTTQAES